MVSAYTTQMDGNTYYVVTMLIFVADKTLNVQNLSLAMVQVTNWHTLGIRLGVPTYQLKNIEQSYPMNNERCKNEMLSVWLQMSPAACWRDVARALHEIDHHVLAKIIHRDYEQGCYLSATGVVLDKQWLKVTCHHTLSCVAM